MRPTSPAALAAIALAAIGMLAGGCGSDDEASSGASTTGAAGPAGSTTTASGGEQGGGPGDSSATGGTGSATGGSDGAPASADQGAAASDDQGAAASDDQGAPTVQAAIEAVLTDAGSPEQACGTYITERFLQRAYGGRANCLAARRPNALARSVEITRSFVNEQGAHAVAVPTGGPYDGAKVEIEVVPANGFGGAPYRLDSLKANIPAGP